MRFPSGWCLLMLSASLLTATTAEAQLFRVYIGNYSRAPEGGIYQAKFDADTGKLEAATLAGPATNASFLAIAPSQKFLYAVGEISDFNGQKTGGVTAFAIDAGTGALTPLNSQSSGGAGPCHIVLDRTGATALVANYGGGSVASLPINAEGQLLEAASSIVHKGSSVNPSRQKGPHAHSINLDPAGRFAFVADLGIDQIVTYEFNADRHTLAPHNTTSVAAGAGPRHFAFHPTGKYAYVINELANTVIGYTYDAAAGVLKEQQTLSTLPEGTTETSYTAEVVVHPSGQFLYGSNRGHDTLAVYQIDPETGKLTSSGFTPIGGKTPRNFVIDPTGKWVLIGCQGSNTITVFAVDQKTGALTATGQSIETPSPVCLRFLPL